MNSIKLEKKLKTRSNFLKYSVLALTIISVYAFITTQVESPKVAPNLYEIGEKKEQNLVELRWEPIPEVLNYRVQIAHKSDDNFLYPILSEVKSSGYHIIKLNAGEYKWRVRAKNHAGAGPWSEVKTIQVSN